MTSGPSDDYVGDFEEEGAGLIDEKAIRDILEKAQDAVRGLGLTFNPAECQLTVNQGQTYALVPMIIRPSAKKKLVQDQESREMFNKMMAEEADLKIQAEAERFRNIAQDPEALEKFLFGDAEEEVNTCEHRAPEGICVLCGAEVEI